MAEIDAIGLCTNGPVTEAGLVEDLGCIGVLPGMTLMVHSSLSSMGWVCGGAVAVIRALEAALGENGTLVMPTYSCELSNPAEWQNPPVDESWWQTIRDTMPAFDADLTPTRNMGAVPECFRKQPGVLRSQHPQLSFAAWGRHAEFVVSNHSLSYGLGEQSPLARIYELDGHILQIGVGHDSNTSLHLAEYRAQYASKTIKRFEGPVTKNGIRKWMSFDDIDIDADDFSNIGSAYEASGGDFSIGKIGYADSVFMPQKQIVDFAVGWMEQHRK